MNSSLPTQSALYIHAIKTIARQKEKIKRLREEIARLKEVQTVAQDALREASKVQYAQAAELAVLHCKQAAEAERGE